MSVANGDNIIIVYNPNNRKKASAFVSKFNERFPYMRDLNLRFTPEYDYAEYEEDLESVKRGYFTWAEISDGRDLPGYSVDARLLLADKFFEVDENKAYELILHELGHYFTNPDLIEIRQFIAVENLKIKLLNVPHPSFKNLVQAHNRALNFIFNIPKLMQEVGAVLWVVENEPQYAESWIRGYCDGLILRSTKADKGYLYVIPELNYVILWLKAIIRYTDYSYTQDCDGKCSELNKAFLRLAERAGWRDLKILKLQRQVLDCLAEEDVQGLIRLYRQIFRDFIVSSSSFFPPGSRPSMLSNYGLSPSTPPPNGD